MVSDKERPIFPEAFRLPIQFLQNAVQLFNEFFAVALQPGSAKVLPDGDLGLKSTGIATETAF